MTFCIEPSCGGPIECSDNGYCIFGTCFCFPGYEGVNCETEIQGKSVLIEKLKLSINCC